MGKLTTAVIKGNLDEVKNLLTGEYKNSSLIDEEKEAEGEMKDANAIGIAVEKQKINILRELLKAGANVNYPLYNDPQNGLMTPICFSIIRGDLQAFQELLNAGAKVDNSLVNGKVLYLAVGGGNVDILRVLLDKGFHVDQSDDFHGTPLLMIMKEKKFTKEKKFEIVKLLVERGANIEAKGKDGKTPRSIAETQQLINIQEVFKKQQQSTLLTFAFSVNSYDVNKATFLESERKRLSEKLQAEPENLDILGPYAALLQKMGRYSESLAIYDHYLKLESNDPAFLLKRAEVLIKLERFTEALQNIEKVAQLEPINPTASLLRLISLLMLGKHDEVKKVFDQQNSLSDPKARNNPVILRLAGLLNYLLITPNSSSNEYQEVLDYLGQSLKIEEDAYTLVLRTQILSKLGKYKEALTNVNLALAFYNDNPDALMTRGQIQFAQQNYGSALEDVNHAIELKPDEPKFYIIRALVLLASDHRDDAKKDYTKADSLLSTNNRKDLFTENNLKYLKSKLEPKSSPCSVM